MEDDVDGILDIDSICCYVTPKSLDALSGPILYLATCQFRLKGDKVAAPLCQVTTDPAVFIEVDKKDPLILTLKSYYQVLIPSYNPLVISKKKTAIPKRTLIHALSQVTTKVWVVRHGLKDVGVGYLRSKIDFVPDPNNRIDIGTYFSTRKVEIFEKKIP
jgi:hypothetical protein